MSTDRTTSELEAQLYANSALAVGSKAAETLERLKKARGHLAYLTLAVAAPATGFLLAGPDKDFAGMTREQCTALAREAMAYLESLIPPK